MMSFTAGEIFFSILCAIIFGFGFSFLTSMLLIIREIAHAFGSIMKKSLTYEKILPPPSIKSIKINQAAWSVVTVLWVVLFMLGFSILSYVALDGEIRLYMLVLSFASFYLSKSIFFVYFGKLLIYLFGIIFSLISIMTRIIITLVRKIKEHTIK